MTEIAVEDLVHVYGHGATDGGVRAVDGVSLRIGAGERVRAHRAERLGQDDPRPATWTACCARRRAG